MYNTFFYTFCITSFVCFIMEYFYTELRVNYKIITKEIILTDYYNMLPLVILNLVGAYPLFYYIELYHTDTDAEYTEYTLLFNCLLWIITTELLFYIIHISFHNKYLYYMHKTHHAYKYTYGIGSIYAHPVEFYLANLIPISLPIVLYTIPLWFCKVVVGMTTMYTVIIAHGGFNLSMSQKHLQHHLRFKCNYGLFKMDKLMGTYYVKDQSTSSIVSSAEVAVEAGADSGDAVSSVEGMALA